MTFGGPWRHRLEPGQSSDLDIPCCFEGLDLWQLVQHVGASNLVRKWGSLRKCPRKPRQQPILPTRAGSQSEAYSPHGPDIKTRTTEVHWEPEQTWDTLRLHS